LAEIVAAAAAAVANDLAARVDQCVAEQDKVDGRSLQREEGIVAVDDTVLD
jgi:hypothetical protein